MQGRYGNGDARFQPTLPVRGATVLAMLLAKPVIFQPTLPVRGATESA